MKRKIRIFLLSCLALLGIYLSSCSEKTTSTGNLTISVVDSTDAIIPYIMVHVAVSYDDLENKNYYRSEYTNAAGDIRFTELPPREYWYKVDGYEDLGSILVYAGKDYFVTLYTNSPEPGK